MHNVIFYIALYLLIGMIMLPLMNRFLDHKVRQYSNHKLGYNPPSGLISTVFQIMTWGPAMLLIPVFYMRWFRTAVQFAAANQDIHLNTMRRL